MSCSSTEVISSVGCSLDTKLIRVKPPQGRSFEFFDHRQCKTKFECVYQCNCDTCQCDKIKLPARTASVTEWPVSLDFCSLYSIAESLIALSLSVLGHTTLWRGGLTERSYPKKRSATLPVTQSFRKDRDTLQVLKKFAAKMFRFKLFHTYPAVDSRPHVFLGLRTGRITGTAVEFRGSKGGSSTAVLTRKRNGCGWRGS